MIDADGLITAAEAAKRLRLSTEQVRRKLREGKLKGRRIGNQWFVEEQALPYGTDAPKHLVSPRLIAEIDELRRRIAGRNPDYEFDPVKMVRRVRGEA